MNYYGSFRNIPVFLFCLLLPCLGSSAASLSAASLLDVRELEGETTDIAGRFASFFEPIEKEDIVPHVPETPLPLNLEELSNPAMVDRLHISEAIRGKVETLLTQHAFAVCDWKKHDDIVSFYKELEEKDVPIFITTDSMLHLYHIQFDETLRDIEERVLYEDATTLAHTLGEAALDVATKEKGRSREAARLLAAYFAVAERVLVSDTTSVEAAVQAFNEAYEKEGIMELLSFNKKYRSVLDELKEFAESRTDLESIPRGFVRPFFGVKEKQEMKQWFTKVTAAYLAMAQGAQDLINLPPDLSEVVEREVTLIQSHAAFVGSPLFGYREDYTQYVPRGHYTRSEKLKRYFKAMMWFGRLPYLVKSDDWPGGGLVGRETARIQTAAAALASALLGSTEVEGRSAARIWDRMYTITAFYVGFSDDLTPYEYRKLLRALHGDTFSFSLFNDSTVIDDFREQVATLRKPVIYSGTGEQIGPLVRKADEQVLIEKLRNTHGLRFMGQRYIPDSYMMGRLVYPTIGLPLPDAGTPFTFAVTRGGPARVFPRGLDIMAVLGSERARAILHEIKDDRYERYDETFESLRREFSTISRDDWNRNIYWSWLYCLKGLLKEFTAGYPTFMRSTAWEDKTLNAVLGSWSQLRHDTILYAKQSFSITSSGVSRPSPPPMIEGYVEPALDFYRRLAALSRMTGEGLSSMDVLSPQAVSRLESLENIVNRLIDISERELENTPLSERDYSFIRTFSKNLKRAVAGVVTKGLQTTIVADVHTDQNTGKVLEEGTGPLRLLLVCYPMPDGGTVLGAGPVLSYYEFKHPMGDRLTDEKWSSMIETNNSPPPPEWIHSFTVLK